MKDILFIAPIYFDYYKSIVKSLSDLGYHVVFFSDTIPVGIDILPNKLKNIWLKKHQNKLLEIVANKKFEYLFVIGGKCFDSLFLKHFFSIGKFDVKILYQWDSLNNFDYRSMLRYFDIVYTFDRRDSELLNIKYLPLFYIKTDDNCVLKNRDIDILFIGIWHSDRCAILDEIADYANKNNLSYFFKLYYPLGLYCYLRYIKHINIHFYTYRKIPLKQTQELYKKAKCIIDINHPSQTGLTMRTMEAVGARKKLLTTNEYILKEDFFNPKMIQVIERSNISIDPNFFKMQLPYKNIEQYEINFWLKKILDEKD